MKIHIEPNLSQLYEIETWLKAEKEKSNEGFYCNWNIIEDSFNQKQLIVFEYELQTIGFISWSTYNDTYVLIDIMEIHQKYRKNGLGNSFYKKAEEYFKSKKFIAIKLFCSPEESEFFWKKMKFIKFPDTGYSEHKLAYYKPLITINKSEEIKTENKLELWDLEPYQVREKKSTWTWEIFSNKKPILQPCDPNWNLRLTINGKIIKEGKVKRFSSNNKIQIGSFLYISNPLNII